VIATRLLRSSLGVVGTGPVAAEAPDDNQAGDPGDGAVHAVTDQRDRVRHDPGCGADHAFSGHPHETQPRDELDAGNEDVSRIIAQGEGCVDHSHYSINVY
jgi:hypothetical protein